VWRTNQIQPAQCHVFPTIFDVETGACCMMTHRGTRGRGAELGHKLLVVMQAAPFSGSQFCI
jgi:hypothetical protein